jgi:hypothetical protein
MMGQHVLSENQDASQSPEAALRAIREEFEALKRRVAELEATFSRNAEPDPVDFRTEQLRQACEDLEIPVSGDGFVREADAGRLLNRAAKTLRNWRDQSRPLEYRVLGNRVEYSLLTLAAFLVERGEE